MERNSLHAERQEQVPWGVRDVIRGTRQAMASVGLPLLDISEGLVAGTAYVAGRTVRAAAVGVRQLYNGVFHS